MVSIKRLFTGIIIAIIIFLSFMLIVSENFLLNQILSSQYQNELSNLMDMALNDIQKIIYKNVFVILGIAIVFGISWIIFGASVKVDTPGEVDQFKKWWWIIAFIGFLLSLIIYCYFWIFSIETELCMEGYIWVGIMNFIYYCIPFWLITLFGSPPIVEPVVPLSSNI